MQKLGLTNRQKAKMHLSANRTRPAETYRTRAGALSMQGVIAGRAEMSKKLRLELEDALRLVGRRELFFFRKVS